MIDDSKKPLLFTVVAAGLAATVSVPLSYIVGTVVTIALGTSHDVVGAAPTTPYQSGIIAGVVTMAVFVLYVSYATYSYNKAKYVTGTAE